MLTFQNKSVKKPLLGCIYNLKKGLEAQLTALKQLFYRISTFGKWRHAR